MADKKPENIDATLQQTETSSDDSNKETEARYKYATRPTLVTTVTACTAAISAMAVQQQLPQLNDYNEIALFLAILTVPWIGLCISAYRALTATYDANSKTVRTNKYDYKLF